MNYELTSFACIVIISGIARAVSKMNSDEHPLTMVQRTRLPALMSEKARSKAQRAKGKGRRLQTKE